MSKITLDAIHTTLVALKTYARHSIQQSTPIASLDAKISQVREVIRDRKQAKALKDLHQQTSTTHASDDPIKILKLRFAKGEIDRKEYEEKLKLLRES